jgi:hypothetical protein
LNDTHEESAIAFANFAHSYCSSAIVLQHVEIDTTHPNSVVTYLFYHSIELYLKAYLMSQGISAQKLKSYGHKIGKLSRKASALGLSFSEFDDEIFEFMTSSDTVISARVNRRVKRDQVAA